jgi:cytidine deaminase
VSPDRATIAAEDASKHAAERGLAPDALLASLLPWATAFADAPVSGFRVGAVARGRSGALYAGGNLELRGLPLAASVHAEQAVVANAWLHGEAGLDALAVTATPCGHCRQFLNELDGAASLRIAIAGRPPATLGELLPSAFGPADLGVAGRLMTAQKHGLSLDARDADPLALEALAAADASYAPYTGAFAGVALRTADGATLTGRYAECAAYNPSLPALQAALVALALRGTTRRQIAEAVMVEADGPASQRSAAEAVLASIGIPLRYLRADAPARTP